MKSAVLILMITVCFLVIGAFAQILGLEKVGATFILAGLGCIALSFAGAVLWFVFRGLW